MTSPQSAVQAVGVSFLNTYFEHLQSEFSTLAKYFGVTSTFTYTEDGLRESRIATGPTEIQQLVVNLGWEHLSAQGGVRVVSALVTPSVNDAILVTATGTFSVAQGAKRQFSQTFLLARTPGRDAGYYYCHNAQFIMGPSSSTQQQQPTGILAGASNSVYSTPMPAPVAPAVTAVPEPQRAPAPEPTPAPEPEPEPEEEEPEAIPEEEEEEEEEEEVAPEPQPVQEEPPRPKGGNTWASRAAGGAKGHVGGPSQIVKAPPPPSRVPPKQSEYHAGSTGPGRGRGEGGERGRGGRGAGRGFEGGRGRGQFEPRAPTFSVFVQPVQPDTASNVLESAFERFGKISSSRVMNREHQQHAFVDFAEEGAMKAAIAAAESGSVTVAGTEVKVVPSRPRPNNNNWQGRGGFGGRGNAGGRGAGRGRAYSN